MIRRTTTFVFEAIATVAAGVAVIVAVGIWQFSKGPVSLDFLNPYVETALAGSEGNLRVTLDHTYLAWEGWQRTIDLRATHVRAYDNQGRLVALVPEVALSLSARAMLHGIVAPATIEVRGAEVQLRRDKDGRVELEFGAVAAAPPANAPPIAGAVTPPPQAAGAATPSIVQVPLPAPVGGSAPVPAAPTTQILSAHNPMDVLPLLAEELLQTPDPTKATGYLRSVSISEANLRVDDDHWHTSWNARLRNLVLQRDEAGIKASGALDVVVQGETAHLQATAVCGPDCKAMTLDLRFDDLRPDRFAQAAPPLAAFSRLKLPLDGTVTLRLGATGALEALNFDVMGGPGMVSLPELYPEDTEIHHLEARGSVSDGGNRMTLEAAALDLGGPVISLAGNATGLDGDSHADLELGLKNLPVDDLPRRWPVSVAPNPRTWIVANLSGGQVDELHLTASLHGHATDLDNVALDKLQGTMKVGGVNVRYIPKMPKVRKTGGDITFDEKTFTIKLDRGNAEGLTVDNATIVISGLDARDQMLAVDLAARGPLRSALQLINSDPLDYASALGIDPKRISGQAAVRLLLQYPLLKNAGFDKVSIAAAANMTDVTLAQAILGHDLDKADLKLRVDKTGMDLSGQGIVGPMPVTLGWREGFGAVTDRRIEIKGDLDDAARTYLGFDASPLLSGSVPATLTLGATDRKTSHLDVDLDLAKAKLALPWFEWSKGAGEPGKARLRLVLKDDRLVALESFEIDAADLKTSGSARFAPGPGGSSLEELDFTRLDFGLNHLSGSIGPRPGGGYKIHVGGDSFDAAPFFKGKPEKPPADKTAAAAPPPTPSKGPPLSISIDVGKLWLTPSHHQPMLAAKGTIEDDGTRISAASLTANSYEGVPVTCMMSPSGTGRLLTISSPDAGAVLRTLGVLDNVVGGKLDLRAEIEDAKVGAPITGVFTIRDYQLTRTPFLAKLLTLASLTGIGDRLSGQGISMRSLNVPFTKLGDKVTVVDGRTVGSELGITFTGGIDLAANTIDINGTIVPVYTLNSLLGNIPGVGHLLVGSSGSGMFAPAYSLRGSLDQPNVSINALSMLTPGIMRGIFNGLGGGEGQGPTPEQAQRPREVPY